MLRTLVLAAALVLLVGPFAVSPALAGKGGNGHGGRNISTSATLWTEPAADSYPAYGFNFVVRGSGFNPNSAVHISLTPNGFTSNVTADSNGDLAFSWTTSAPGTYTFSAYQDMQGNHWDVYAAVSFQVV